ncbi:hypothetical protein ID866_9306 [Astraeus odoratus]|nr:hypothetical protein ID866_9306 [Astraeus odoratus]
MRDVLKDIEAYNPRTWTSTPTPASPSGDEIGSFISFEPGVNLPSRGSTRDSAATCIQDKPNDHMPDGACPRDTDSADCVVCCVRFSADGKYLATGCSSTAQIYDTKTGAKTCVLAHEFTRKDGDIYVRSVCFSPNGKYLATGAEDSQIRIWDIARKSICTILEGHQKEIYSLDFSPDGRLIVSGSGDTTVRIWDVGDGSCKVLTVNDPNNTLNDDAPVTSVAISPNGQLVAAGSLTAVVRVWDITTGLRVGRLRGHRGSAYSIAFTPDGKGLVSGSLDRTLKYWDLGELNISEAKREGTAVKEKKDLQNPNQYTMDFVGHTDYVLSVAISHDGHWVVSGSKDKGVQFWDAHSAIAHCMLQGHKNTALVQ